MNRVNRIGSESTSRLLAEFSIPAIVAMVVQSSYSIIDRIFIGNGAGTTAISGITVCFPVMAIFMAFGMLIGIGGASCYSIKLGEGRMNEFRKIPGNTFILLLLTSVTLSLITGLYLEDVLRIFGASGKTLDYASSYMCILLFGLPFQMTGFGMNNFIRAEGRPWTAMATMLIGSAVNIALAPLLIFRFRLGIEGAALSTVIAQVISCIWVLGSIQPGKNMTGLSMKGVELSVKTTKMITANGLGPFTMQIGACIVASVYNHQLMSYGGWLSLSIYGIIHSISVFLLMPVIGISQGAQPLIGYNFGAGRDSRARNILFKSVAASTVLLVSGFFIITLIPDFFIGIFNPADSELRGAGIHALHLFLSMIPLAAMQICSSGFFIATGNPKRSVLLTLSRQIIFLLPLLLVLPRFFGLDGIWLAAPVSDLAAFILTASVLFCDMKKPVAKPVILSSDGESRALL